MKQPDFDRAFAPTPACVHASIQLAFARGEKRMKLRHKIAGMLSVAAVLVILLAVAALAMDFPAAPQPDVLSPGRPLNTAAPRAEEPASTNAVLEMAEEPTVYFNPKGNYYHFEEGCSGMVGAEPHSLSKAIAAGKTACPVCAPVPGNAEEAYSGGTPEQENAETSAPSIYYTPGGTYFHMEQNCSGMMNAEAHDLYDALLAGKQLCPACLEDAQLFLPGNLEGLHIDLTVYCTETESFYHLTGSCSEIPATGEIPVAMTQAEAVAKGKDGCPACLSFFSSENTDDVGYYVPGEFIVHRHSHAPDGSRTISYAAAYNVGMEHCSACNGRWARSEEDFIAIVKAADPEAAKAEKFYVYFAADGESAWVFCCTRTGVYHEGAFWHVQEGKPTLLGRSDAIWDWFYHTDTEPGIFTFSIGKPEERRAWAFILKDGLPCMLEGAEDFASLSTSHGRLYGMLHQDYDYCFLEIADNQLQAVEAEPLANDDFLKMNGAADVLEAAMLYDTSYELASCLQRSNGVITLNLFSSARNETEHYYVYITEAGLEYDRGWSDEAAMLPGEASPAGMRYYRS